MKTKFLIAFCIVLLSGNTFGRGLFNHFGSTPTPLPGTDPTVYLCISIPPGWPTANNASGAPDSGSFAGITTARNNQGDEGLDVATYPLLPPSLDPVTLDCNVGTPFPDDDPLPNE